jgi:hypothetical protein
MVRISVVNIHFEESASPFSLPFSAMAAVPKPAKPLMNASSNAMMPRVLHPSRSTGDKATARKRTGMMAGAMIWRMIVSLFMVAPNKTDENETFETILLPLLER